MAQIASAPPQPATKKFGFLKKLKSMLGAFAVEAIEAILQKELNEHIKHKNSQPVSNSKPSDSKTNKAPPISDRPQNAHDNKQPTLNHQPQQQQVHITTEGQEGYRPPPVTIVHEYLPQPPAPQVENHYYEVINYVDHTPAERHSVGSDNEANEQDNYKGFSSNGINREEMYEESGSNSDRDNDGY